MGGELSGVDDGGLGGVGSCLRDVFRPDNTEVAREERREGLLMVEQGFFNGVGVLDRFCQFRDRTAREFSREVASGTGGPVLIECEYGP